MSCLKDHNTETVVTVYVLRYIRTKPISASGKLNKLAMVMAKISKSLLTLHTFRPTFQTTATPLCLCLLFLFTFTLLIELIREIYKF